MQNTKKWVIRSQPLEGANLSSEAINTLIREFSEKANLSPLVAKMVLARNQWQFDKAMQFLGPSLRDMRAPETLPDMEGAVSRLIVAIDSGEPVFVHGDYDVDGVCAVTMMAEGLRALGVKQVIPFVPERDQDGYGLSKRGIEACLAAQAKLLMTCDCGITAVEEVALAKEKGIEVIVTDHHLPEAQLPKALAIVNPNRQDADLAFKGLCGTGVVFCFLIALRKALREQGYFNETNQEPDLRAYLDLLSLATVADVVPLVEDNRTYVKKGLAQIQESTRPGIRALLESTGLWQQKIESWHLAFKLIPRLNSGGRMGKAELSMQLLLEKDLAKAREMAQTLEELNQKRRELEQGVREQALAQVQTLYPDGSYPGLVLSGDDWHHGILGIVAARICDAYYVPTIVISFEHGQGVGSARGVEGINIVEAFKACDSHLVRYGGHALAAGLTIEKTELEGFRKGFSRYMQEHVKQEDLVPRLYVDEHIDLDDVDADLLADLERLSPFGEANPEPVFTIKNARVKSSQIVGDNHLRLICENKSQLGQASIGFGLGHKQPKPGQEVSLAFVPRWNEFRGRRKIQLELKDILF